MTLFDPKSIQVLGADSNGNNVILCTMYVDTIADLPAQNAFSGTVLSMGCRAIVINDNSVHRLNSAGQWIQIVAGSSTYTRAEIGTMIARIDATEAEDRAALVQLVDRGAKNLVDAGSGTGTRFINIPITLQPGDYYVKFNNITSTDTDASVCQFGAFAEDNSEASNLIRLTRGDDTGGAFTVTQQTSYVRLYASSSYAGGARDTVNFTGCMICTAADYDISPAYVPYAPTNRDLYELIRGYHP